MHLFHILANTYQVPSMKQALMLQKLKLELVGLKEKTEWNGCPSTYLLLIILSTPPLPHPPPHPLLDPWTTWSADQSFLRNKLTFFLFSFFLRKAEGEGNTVNAE